MQINESTARRFKGEYLAQIKEMKRDDGHAVEVKSLEMEDYGSP